MPTVNLIKQFVPSYRYDKCRSVAPGGARLPHAVPSRMSHCSIWHYVGMLAQGPHEAANIWDPTVEAGGLLYNGRFGVQRGIGILRTRPPPGMATLNATVTPSSSSPPHVEGSVMGCFHHLLPSHLSHKSHLWCSLQILANDAAVSCDSGQQPNNSSWYKQKHELCFAVFSIWCIQYSCVYHQHRFPLDRATRCTSILWYMSPSSTEIFVPVAVCFM